MNVLIDQNLRGRRAVVIGAGAAGLAAAIGLAARGARVRVLEQAPVAGGRLATLKLGNHHFDVGEDTVAAPRIFGRLFALADHRLSDFLDFKPIEPFARLIFPDGQPLNVFSDPQRLAAEVERFSPEDAAQLAREWHRWERHVAQADEQFFQLPGHGRAGLTRLAANPLAWKTAARLINPLSLDRTLKRRFKGREVREIFAYLAGRMGASPSHARAGVLPLILEPLIEGAWVPVGGMAKITEALLRLAALLGVRVSCGCTVERIELENGHVRRVTGQGFKPLRTDMIVSTATPGAVLGMLAEPGEMAEKWLESVKRLPLSRSALTIFLSSDRAWETLGRLETVFLGAEERENARQIDIWRVAPAIPPIHVFRTMGKNDHQRTGLKIVVPQPPVTSRFAWNKVNEARERERVMQRLEAAGLEGFENAIMEEFVMNPAATERGTNLPGGALYGASLNKWQGFMARGAQACPATGGLFFAGAWTHPGPSLAQVVTSGMLAAERAASER